MIWWKLLEKWYVCRRTNHWDNSTLKLYPVRKKEQKYKIRFRLDLLDRISSRLRLTSQAVTPLKPLKTTPVTGEHSWVQKIGVCVTACFLGASGHYGLIHGCRRHSAAVVLFSGMRSNMGKMKSEKVWASSRDHSYFSTSTSSKPHGFSLVMCLKSPNTDKQDKITKFCISQISSWIKSLVARQHRGTCWTQV